MILAVFGLQDIAWAADFQPLPAVALPPLATVPPTPGTQPTSLTPPNIVVTQPEPVRLPPSTAPTAALPSGEISYPSTQPGSLSETAPETAVPELSQPLRPVPPETATETAKKIEEEGIFFNLADEDIREVVKQISRALGKNFLLDDKLKGKLTIISERKMTKDEVWEAFQSALDVLGFTVVQGPAGLLKIVATRDALSNPIDVYTDSTPFTDRFITRLITLKNISAGDMANVIKGMISKEGNLFAYPVTNTLILTDSGTNINRVIKLINELDQEGPQEVLEMIPIIYANAKDLAAKITQIYETDKAGQAGAAAPAARARRGAQAAGASVETGEEVPRLRKVIPDERTNTLIVLASKMAIQKVRDLIKKLDSPLAGDEGEVHVYYLKHAVAKDMATVLTALSGQVGKEKEKKPTGAAGGAAGGAQAQQAPSPVSSLIGGAEFEGKFTVTADESTNALVITAGSKDYNTLIDQVISKLDIPRRQVYVETVIVEISINSDQQLGVGALGGKQFNVGGNNLALFGSTFGFLDPTQILRGAVGAGTDNTFDVTTPNLGSAANTTEVPAFFAALQLSQANTNANILSTPNILTLDNQEAEIIVGQKVPFPTASATTIGGSLQNTFTREDVALTLKIKPQISEGGAIRLEVSQEDNAVLDVQSTFANTAGPTTTKRSIKTAIVASDGQTMVLGGLIRDSYTTSVQKVPGLGDIPILGYLFKVRRKRKDKINLLVFLTPHIIREPRDFLKILQKKIDEQKTFIQTNLSKSEQKQIRTSLEHHADYLLRAGEQGYMMPEEKKPLTLEEKFPMEVTPTTRPNATESSAPITSAGNGEDSDLALEQSKGQSKKKSKKKKSPPPAAPVAPSGSESAPKKSPETGSDVDLTY